MFVKHFAFKFLEVVSPFRYEVTDTPVWVSRPGLILHLHAYSPVYNGFLRFTCVVTPAYLFKASIVAEPFLSSFLWNLMEMDF